MAKHNKPSTVKASNLKYRNHQGSSISTSHPKHNRHIKQFPITSGIKKAKLQLQPKLPPLRATVNGNLEEQFPLVAYENYINKAVENFNQLNKVVSTEELKDIQEKYRNVTAEHNKLAERGRFMAKQILDLASRLEAAKKSNRVAEYEKIKRRVTFAHNDASYQSLRRRLQCLRSLVEKFQTFIVEIYKAATR